MLAIALLAAASLLPEFEVVVGYASPNADGFREGPLAPALGARAGIDFADHLTLSARVLGVAGPETSSSFCGGSGGCRSGSASFRAISGFASLRLHTAGDLQGFIEGDLGVGHLISLSDNDLFENPAEHGRGGLAPHKAELAELTNGRGVTAGLEEALRGADVYIGVSSRQSLLNWTGQFNLWQRVKIWRRSPDRIQWQSPRPDCQVGKVRIDVGPAGA